MVKKLLLAGSLTTALAVLALVAQPVSADYYDCNGNIRSGDPRPSECHYYITPPSNADRTRADVVTNSSSTSSYDSDRTRAGVVTNSSSTSSYDSSRTRANVVTEIGRNYSDLEEARNRDDAVIVNDPDNYSKKYEVRNARKYCMRDYCYIVYDYCYDLTHCEEKVYKMPREDYGDRDDWRDMFGDYYNRSRNEDNCDQDRYGRSRCVYRGFHFGGFHNGYWYY